jgi:glucose dehydrogenase
MFLPSLPRSLIRISRTMVGAAMAVRLVMAASAIAAETKNRQEVLEDAEVRQRLPEFRVTPAADPAELTPGTRSLPEGGFRSWTVSHGDAGSRRYSALAQIDRGNVKNLRVAWTYHSRDGSGNIQCNPIVVDGVMFAPTVGRAIVALDARDGRELWRFALETRGNSAWTMPRRAAGWFTGRATARTRRAWSSPPENGSTRSIPRPASRSPILGRAAAPRSRPAERRWE